jgi:hypothetical protein
MGRDGTLPGGAVDEHLLVAAPDAPFGVRLDEGRVVDAVETEWRDRSVVLVEASDLVRAEAYRLAATEDRRGETRAAALRGADRLLGRLLRRVDPARDLVVVLGTVPDPDRAALAVVAIRAPGLAPGLMRSGTTQRAGFVQLMDVAPTVLDRLGVPRPDSMRGRPIRVDGTSGTGSSRRAYLVDVDAATRFRAEIVNPVAIAFIVLVTAVVVAAALALGGAGRGRARAAARLLAAAALAYLPSVYLARLLPLHDAGVAAYGAFVAVCTILLATAALVASRGRALDTALIGLGIVAGVLVADGLLGSNLQLNSGLGFSAEVAGRFIGYGNAGYAALVGAGLIAHRVGGRRGAWCGVAVLAVALVVDGAPFWGADVGGVLSMVPAYGIAAVVLLGWRLRARTVVLVAAGTVAAVALAAFVDVQRPSGDRTHLGRLVEQVGGEGFDAFATVVQRKLGMNVGSLTSSVWRVLVPVALAFLAYAAFTGRRPLVELLRRIPELRAVLVGFSILLVLGYALNDTGVLVPAIMLGVLVPSLVTLLLPAAASVSGRDQSVDAPDA